MSLKIPEGHQEREEVAVVLHTLFSGASPGPWPDPLPVPVETAVEWQKMGAHATFAEAHGVRSRVVQGRLAEVIGRVASAGEQLGLAWTCDQEATRWLNPDQERPLASQVASRALAELTGYYALSAAHGVGNVTLRTLLIAPGAAAVINKEYKKANGFPPFSDDRNAWQPLNTSLAKVLQAAAAQVGQPVVTRLVDIVADLVQDPRWAALTSRRDVDFHRWRPQSVPGGVPTASPWEHGDGVSSLTAYAGSQHQPPNPHELVQEASEGLGALADAMSRWLVGWPAALRDLGVPVFKTA